MKLVKILIILSFIGVLGHAQADTAQPLAARFEVNDGKTSSDWYLWRDEKRIETANPATAQGNIWERLERGGYSHRRIFHHDQRVIEYTAGEIRTRRAEPDWPTLASIISPQALDKLERGASKPLFGQQAVHYSGQMNGQQVDLWWLEDAQLPAQLQLVNSTGYLRIKLLEIRTQAPNQWPRATNERIVGYGVIDAADIGDKESDPFIARLQQADADHVH